MIHNAVKWCMKMVCLQHDVLADVCNVTFVLCLRERHYEDLREFGVDCHDAEDLDWVSGIEFYWTSQS